MVTAEAVYASSAGIVHEIAHEIAVEKERIVTKSFPFVCQRPKVSHQQLASRSSFSS
jgi:hypothetical protein